MESEPITKERPASEVCCLEPVTLREPLRSKDYIRLLLFYPPKLEDLSSSSPQDVPLRCDVFQASLNDLQPSDKASFAALSYRWGDSAKTKSVFCGELPLKIHENLYEALTKVSFHNRPRLLWTDGLCIDQDDDTEKSNQVARMSHIYRSAHVVIYLGQSVDPDADAKVIDAFHILERAYDTFEEQTAFEYFDEADYPHLKQELVLEAKKSGVNRLQDLPWLGMLAFFTNPYFQRAWIVQEVTWSLSHEVHFDKWLISFECLAKSARLLHHCNDIASQVIAGTNKDWNSRFDLTHGITSANLLLKRSAYDYTNGGRLTNLLSRYSPRKLVDFYSNRECSDPRDHIYSLASLFPPGPRGEFPVDYSFTTLEVFTMFACTCFMAHKDLILLNGSARQSFWSNPQTVFSRPRRSWVHGLPSWCPDWSGPFRAARELVNLERNGSILWRSAGDTMPVFTIVSQNTLGLKGLLVGRIVDCSVPLTFHVDYDANFEQELLLMEDFMLKQLKIMPIAQIWRLYICVLLAPRTRDAVDVVQELYPGPCNQKTYSNMLRDLGPIWLQNCAKNMFRRARFTSNRSFRKRDVERAKGLRRIMYDRSYNTRLIVTTDGCVGTAPNGSRPGDEVCILYGGKTPYIVRPHEDGVHYTFVGEAYIFGLMDGEAMDLDLPEREFHLV